MQVLTTANRLPLEFWRVLHSEYGIIVYPSAMTEHIDIPNLGMDVTFTEAYHGHIGESFNDGSSRRGSMLTTPVMFPRCCGSKRPPRCPFEYLQEPPPVYQE